MASEEWSSDSSSTDSESSSDIQPSSCNAGDFNTPHRTKTSPTKFHQIYYQFFGFLLLWQAAFNISNTAISTFMKFFKYFILSLGRAFHCDSLSSSSKELPVTRETVVQLLYGGDKGYREYVVCPKCDSLYEYEDCIKHNPKLAVM